MIIVTIAIFLALCFLPLLWTKKGHPYRTQIILACVGIAIGMVLSLNYDYGQDAVLIAWVTCLAVSWFTKPKAVTG